MWFDMYDRFLKKETWTDYDPQGIIADKVKLIKELIPNDVNTILDVGCGNGIITNILSKTWDVTGVDISDEALSYLQCKKIKASATSIPLPDKSFDILLSSEMLEHLSASEILLALSEFKRISRKYIIISVPNNENLQASYAKCPACGFIYHAWQHQQTFTKSRMRTLFLPEFINTCFSFCGESVRKWLPVLLTLKHLLGQWMTPEKAPLCPHCGNTEFVSGSKNVFTKLINGLNHLLAGKKHYWMIALFERVS